MAEEAVPPMHAPRKRKREALAEPPQQRSKAACASMRREQSDLHLSMQSFDALARSIMSEIDDKESAPLEPRRTRIHAARAGGSVATSSRGSEEVADGAGRPPATTKFQDGAVRTLQYAAESFLIDVAEDVVGDLMGSKPRRKRAVVQDFLRAEAGVRPGTRSRNAAASQQDWKAYLKRREEDKEFREKCDKLSGPSLEKLARGSQPFQLTHDQPQSPEESILSCLRFLVQRFTRGVLESAGVTMRRRRHQGTSFCMRSDDIREGVKQSFGRISYGL